MVFGYANLWIKLIEIVMTNLALTIFEVIQFLIAQFGSCKHPSFIIFELFFNLNLLAH